MKQSYLILTLILMFFVGMQLAGVATAAKPKLIDQGKMTNNSETIVWKTYQYNKNYIVVKKDTQSRYSSQGSTLKTTTKTSISIKKTKKLIKYVLVAQSYYKPYKNAVTRTYSKSVTTVKTAHNAKWFYYYFVKPFLWYNLT